MGKSFRKHAIKGNACGDHVSEKRDKREANRKLRSRMNRKLKNISIEDLDDYVDLDTEDVSSSWSFQKDGKSYHSKDEFENEVDFYKKVLRK